MSSCYSINVNHVHVYVYNAVLGSPVSILDNNINSNHKNNNNRTTLAAIVRPRLFSGTS